MSDDPKDPRFRAYRAAALGVYLVIACVFSVLIIYSVFKSVLGMTPDRVEFVGTAMGEDECLRQARSFFEQLEQQRKEITTLDTVRGDDRFLQFRIDWLTRKRRIEAQCAVDSREKLKTVYGSLEHLMDLYTTDSVQFSSAIGPAVETLKSQLALP